MHDTRQLLTEAKAGNRRALDQLVSRHRGRLLMYVTTRLRSGTPVGVQADDIVQETYVEAARKIDAFEPQGRAAFYRWLVGIARFKLQEAARAGRAKKRAILAPLVHDPQADQTSPSMGAARTERSAVIADAVAELPDGQRQAVRLRYLEGRSVAECATELGRSEASVKGLVSRGLATLASRVRNTL